MKNTPARGDQVDEMVDGTVRHDVEDDLAPAAPRLSTKPGRDVHPPTGPQTTSQTALGRNPQAADDNSTEDAEPEVSFADFFRRIYQVTYSKSVGLAMILAMAVLVLVGVLITQADPATWNDATAKASFLESRRTKYGGWASLMSLVGFFHVFSSIPFLVVTIALAISIMGCTTHRIPQLWQRFRHPRTVVSDHFFTAARYQAALPTHRRDEAAAKIVAEKLKTAHYRVIQGDDTSVYADRFSWGPFGTVLAHLSFIVILFAFTLSGLTAYDAVLNLSVGSAATAVGHGTNLKVQATDFNATYDDATGRPLDYVSHVLVFDGDKKVAEQDVRVNSPLNYAGWSFHQNTFGLALDVTVTDATGATVFTGSLPETLTTTDSSMVGNQFHIDDRGLTITVWTPASGVTGQNVAPGQVVFVIYRDGQTGPTNMVTVDQGSSLTVGDLEFGFDRESQYTGILAHRDPGAPWMWLGSVLLVMGMTLTFTCRHRRVWLRCRDSELLMASADKEDSGFRQDFNELVGQAETWFPGRKKDATRS